MNNHYSINDIISYRKLNWNKSQDFFYISNVPEVFEEFSVVPDYYIFGLLDSGYIDIEIDFKRYMIDRQSLMIYKPGQVIQTKNIAYNTTGAFILFNKSFLDETIFLSNHTSFLDNRSEPHIKLLTEDYQNLRNLFSNIFSLFNRTSSNSWNYTVKNLVSALICETNEILQPYTLNHTSSFNSEEKKLYNKFQQLLIKNCKTTRNIAFYASQLNISSNFLYKIVKEQSGLTPSAIIQKKVINETKYLLAYSTLNISEISSELNFSGIQAFSKYFKKSTAQSPTSYREFLHGKDHS